MDTSTFYITPRPFGALERLVGRRELVGIVHKDGLRHMFLITSNSYRDRENEFITTKALNEYVETNWRGDDFTKQPLLFWHGAENTPIERQEAIGEIIWADMQGPFLLELAREVSGTITHRGKAYPVSGVWDYIEAHPEEGWGASHGFNFLDKQRDSDGSKTYHAIRKFETSVLPRKAAANLYTFAGVIPMGRDEQLDQMLSTPGAAKQLRANAQRLQAVLTNAGKEHKADNTATKGLMEKLDEVIGKFVGQIKDGATPEEIGALKEAIIGILSAAPSPEVEVETETMATDEVPTEELPIEEPTAAEDEKKYAAMMGKQLDILTQISGAVAEMATANADSAKTVKALNERMAALEKSTADTVKQIKMAPRQASRTTETQVKDADLTAAVVKQIDSASKFYGG